MHIIQNAIDGRKVTVIIARASRRSINPATGEQTAELPLSTAAEVNAAVAAAKTAAASWGTTPPLKRIKPMFRFKELLGSARRRDRARRSRKEHGKTHADALGELARGIDVVDFACGIPHLLKGEFSRNVGPEIDSWSDRQPLGVVAGITPFNFPAMVPMWMYPVAIACGNTFILKPSERDPSASMLICDLFQEAGFPAGVLNVVHGDKEAVDAHPRPSRHQGRELRRLDADRRIRLSARLGGGQARAGAGRRQEPHDRHARCRHGPGRRCADGRRLRLGRRALHGDLGRGAGRREDGRPAGRGARAARSA